VERPVASQRELAACLRLSLAGADGPFRVSEIRERDAPEQLVLTELRHVHIGELPWIRSATARLVQSAQRYGGAAGERFVIFHGEVYDDSDGPVEVCLPISVAPTESIDTALRCEPAHREAYAPVTKAQFEMPQILSVYDAVEHWIRSHGLSPAGPPREVYRADVDLDAAAPTDEVCDVAIPSTNQRSTRNRSPTTFLGALIRR
jgi:hypothetical protein